MKLNILVVDDSITIRKLMSVYLEELGHNVIGLARSANEGIALYSQHRPDLVTMDVQMPNISGIEAVQKLKTIDKDAKIIMITAEGSKKTVLEALDKGANGYILKPIMKEKLEESINNVFLKK